MGRRAPSPCYSGFRMFRFLLVLLPLVLLPVPSAHFLSLSNPINRTSVIDPVLSYATYAGGSGKETGKAIAVDVAGNAYLAGTRIRRTFRHSKAGRARVSGDL